VRVVVNGDEVDVEVASAGVPATLGALLEQLGLAGRLVVVERNGRPVPRSEVAATVLAEGDRLELVRAVAGG
jgi:sulfur carrier protein